MVFVLIIMRAKKVVNNYFEGTKINGRTRVFILYYLFANILFLWYSKIVNLLEVLEEK